MKPSGYRCACGRRLYIETYWFSVYIGPDVHRRDGSYGWGVVRRWFTA